MHNTGEQIALQTDEHYVSNVYNRRPTQRLEHDCNDFFPNLNSTKTCWKPSRIKVSLARQPFRPPLFRLRSMAVTFSVQRRPAPVKTAAYLLPALQHLLDFPRKKSGPPRILILTPTRELAMQVADHARELAKHTHLDIATITGGVAYMNHAEVFSENQDIVVATTGRLLQYIKEENFDCPRRRDPNPR
ncbi:ATP-dependent RNA helicase SrmB [Klebsiella pneumoniae]|uniref:ATP-dependent RNA helicase SrmB n=1 Tax=Klebsiella pneumoniae TaxID=573 RepID=A0A377XMP2_KLEPN|nr:ATP-dependent RNA helicase SrmB [Klebsiella pneumoniae]